MDYTTAVQNDNKQPRQPQDSFFTSGVGTNDVDNNSFDSEKNLDLSNQSVEWSNPAERNPENVGIAAIESLGLQNTSPENKDHDISTTELEMPPNATTEESPIENSDEQIAPEQNLSFIKTEKVLSKDAVREISKEINKFNRDGNATNFYEETRRMMEINLKNSYGRELGK